MRNPSSSVRSWPPRGHQYRVQRYHSRFIGESTVREKHEGHCLALALSSAGGSACRTRRHASEHVGSSAAGPISHYLGAQLEA